MSVRQGLLALLAEGPMYGYQLRGEFEARTGATWPLNVGQVYSTLSRLERDGFVTEAGADAEGRVRYRITDSGRDVLRAWFDTPVDRAAPARDELAIKLAMAVTVPGVDVRAVVSQQRAATVRVLQDYTRLKARTAATPSTPAELSWQLVLESLIFDADAEVRWLDHCESRLIRLAGTRATLPGPPATAAPEPATPPAASPAGRGGRRGGAAGSTGSAVTR
jgi:DNA-binding PadR family transcriptional regulator